MACGQSHLMVAKQPGRQGAAQQHRPMLGAMHVTRASHAILRRQCECKKSRVAREGMYKNK
jgi:hypothetical protein